MQMADRNRQRVGSIVRRRCRAQAEQQLHHLADLLLFRAAVADHRAFDLCRCVLHHLAARLHRGKHRYATRMAELQRTADVDGVKQVLDGDAVGATGR